MGLFSALAFAFISDQDRALSKTKPVVSFFSWAVAIWQIDNDINKRKAFIEAISIVMVKKF